MRTLAFTILLAVGSLPTRGDDAFFRHLEEIYLTVFADAMPRLQGAAFSVSMGRGALQSEGFRPIPESLWRRLLARLEAQGIDVQGYVPADRVEIRRGAAYHSGTQTRVTVWSITGIEWLGDSRVLVAKQRFRDGLNGQFHTAVLEYADGHWVVKDRKNQGVARRGPAPAGADAGSGGG